MIQNVDLLDCSLMIRFRINIFAENVTLCAFLRHIIPVCLIIGGDKFGCGGVYMIAPF
jgi:hypothetical protein